MTRNIKFRNRLYTVPADSLTGVGESTYGCPEHESWINQLTTATVPSNFKMIGTEADALIARVPWWRDNAQTGFILVGVGPYQITAIRRGDVQRFSEADIEFPAE
ncbi:MAG: hypothetical protein WCG48_02745 [Candidatus Berkelbacteria bacterium]